MGTNLMRDLATEKGNCFLVTPYGVKVVADRPFDFDRFHQRVTTPTVTGCGLTVHRADSVYGPVGVLDAVWRGIQKAEVVIVDFTGRSENVAIEFAWAMLLGKRVIILTQDEGDIPTDVRGLYRYIKYSEYFDAVEHMKAQLSQQLEAIRDEPANEKILSPMWDAPEAAPAQVIALDREFITVKTDDGRRGILGNTDVSWARIIKDMSRRYSIGERIDGAFVTDRKGARYTMIAGQTNPWPKLVSDYPPGTRFTGTVKSVVDGVGVFVQLGHGVNGRIRPSDLASHAHVHHGQIVEVTVNWIDPERRHINLRLERVLDDAPIATPHDLPAVGTRAWAKLSAIKLAQPDGSSGCLLLKLPGQERAAILRYNAMSDELRHEFDIGDLVVGHEIHVEVTRAVPGQSSVLLKDVLAPKTKEQSAA
jgi:hypothetical protein